MKGTWKVSVHVPGFTADTRRKLVVPRQGGPGVADGALHPHHRPAAPASRSGFLVLDGPTRVRLPIALRPVSVAAPLGGDRLGCHGLDAGRHHGRLHRRAPGGRRPGSSRPQSETFTTARPQPGLRRRAALLRRGHGRCQGGPVRPRRRRRRRGHGPLRLPRGRRRPAARRTWSRWRVSRRSASADERVTLLDPEPGHYLVEVDPFAAAPGKSSLDWRFDFYDVDPALAVGRARGGPEPGPGPVTTRRRRSTRSGRDSTRTSATSAMFEYDGAVARRSSRWTPPPRRSRSTAGRRVRAPSSEGLAPASSSSGSPPAAPRRSRCRRSSPGAQLAALVPGQVAEAEHGQGSEEPPLQPVEEVRALGQVRLLGVRQRLGRLRRLAW